MSWNVFDFMAAPIITRPGTQVSAKLASYSLQKPHTFGIGMA
jgi:hypothetical protein